MTLHFSGDDAPLQRSILHAFSTTQVILSSSLIASNVNVDLSPILTFLLSRCRCGLWVLDKAGRYQPIPVASLNKLVAGALLLFGLFNLSWNHVFPLVSQGAPVSPIQG